MMETPMKRCLTTFDLAFLGIGHMIGAGIYVLTGTVAKNMAGPGIVLSFLFAGIASFLSALCYAEFGARVPKAGSAYSYTYVTVGELWAFVVGWNIIFEHMLCAAAVARSWSGYMDSMLGHIIYNQTNGQLGVLHIGMFDVQPDLVSFMIVVLVCLFLGIGAKCSTVTNTVLTVLNVFVICFVVVYGLILARPEYWTQKDNGGFLPYGMSGVFVGAASCFFAYVGFDSIATAGEEAKNPNRSIPMATFISLSTVTVAYMLMGGALTMMIPYYDIHHSSAFTDAFEQRGITWAKYVIAIGALSGMTTSLIGALFALPRCVYAMAADGLLFPFLAHISTKTQTPTIAMAIFGGVTAVIALLFDVDTLVEFLSIGTLMAYTIVSCCVIILRYQPAAKLPSATTIKESSGASAITSPHSESDALVEPEGGKLKKRYAFLSPYLGRFLPGKVVTYSVATQMVIMMLFSCTIFRWSKLLGNLWTAVIGIATAVVMLICLGLIMVHDQNSVPLAFKVNAFTNLPSFPFLIKSFTLIKQSEYTRITVSNFRILMTNSCYIFVSKTYELLGIWKGKEWQKDPPVFVSTSKYFTVNNSFISALI
ncbi:unnamed protein product [Soboliphyme baturini]|uniref:AA_permease_C domain-containing protein n=1 Tax=Soboliphyme baturini TaxID=241478 RepID=A0A183J2K6_9BILA|nr:unnamed protein product [Soboliphyme baturini]